MTAALAGIVFAIGLIVSDMTSPVRVIGFLDITGNWDPTLAFVMAGAIGALAPAVRVVRRQTFLPEQETIDKKLVAGAAIFGVGWGLAGYCPGPALASVGVSIETGIFVLAMIAGIAVARRLLAALRYTG
jgi:uncharacterized membrane protein YedE/YeeE